jgi:hypothetical protein
MIVASVNMFYLSILPLALNDCRTDAIIILHYMYISS